MSGFVPCLCKVGSAIKGLPVRKRRAEAFSKRLLRVSTAVWCSNVRHFAIRRDKVWAIYRAPNNLHIMGKQAPTLVKSGLTKDAAIMLLMYKD